MAVPSVPYASCWLCHWRAYAGEAKDAFLASLRISHLHFPLEGMWQLDHGAIGVDLHHAGNCACASSVLVRIFCEVAAVNLLIFCEVAALFALTINYY